ncbi:hypothetical protein ACWD6L_28870 [Micromonospora profundi]|uniref:hypothetical protein n=1 Tax=Micromonospora sp. NRRL B-16802 TaxID=1415541 RepID=UPI0006AF90F2|nr:hypothetical protein [Micromonospora sp. NRRL B-16802]KOX02671.1 hypothetical protein ADK66_29430 [Micromonospora sp. NRRL B-16802]
MTVAFDGLLSVSYSQAYVVSDDDPPDPVRAFAGQLNGLCGARVPGALFLVTGRHTGKVAFRVEVVDGPPPVDPGWEEVVEVSFTALSGDVHLMDWHQGMYPLPLRESVSYRVRYCARGMDAGKTYLGELETVVDHYLLVFWPAPVEADRVVRRTSRIAAYWHDEGFLVG